MTGEQAILSALGLEGRPVVRLGLVMTPGQAPCLEVIEERLDLLGENGEALAVAFTRFDLVERTDPDQEDQ